MPRDETHDRETPHTRPIIVIGAGIAGLSAALRLASAGHAVTVVDSAAQPGGKMRTVPSHAGPVDAGPTVLTMRHVFDDLFSAAGTTLEKHVTLLPQKTLARHFWPNDNTLDLHADAQATAQAIASFAGPKAAAEYTRFAARCAHLYDAFDAPMMQAAEPSLAKLIAQVAGNPALLRAMAPLKTMSQQLARDFSDPRLRQLFGRYATYVGGAPQRSPALLNLISHSEARGVWTVAGGMHRLARAIAALAERRGAVLRMNTHAHRIELQNGATAAIHLRDGTRLPCAAIVFAGDPRALCTGALGSGVSTAIADIAHAPRSHSAQVWSFAARPSGPRAPDLLHHNVFFDATPEAEFSDLQQGRIPRTPSIYICAEDRGDGTDPPQQGSLERFEIILNAPALTGLNDTTSEDFSACQTRTFQTLKTMGLSFDPLPDLPSLTTPKGFEALFPSSLGALYGQSPHGMTAALKRPKARTAIKGLYLAGGGCHPGAGIPMATLSGKHAAEAILQDQISTSTSRQTATPGGISTG